MKIAAVTGAAILAAYQFVARPHFQTYGATDRELEAHYPGDDLVPGGRRGGTMTTTLAAPPSAVWPWLVQMGCDRAGWYSWDRRRTKGVLERRPDPPGLAAGRPGGDRSPRSPDGSSLV